MNSNPNRLPPFKRFRYGLQTTVVRALSLVLPWLPFVVVRLMGWCVGTLVYYVGIVPRRIALANLDVAFGNTKSFLKKRRIARRSMQSAATTILTLFWTARAPHQAAHGPRLDRIVDVDRESLETMRSEMLNGRGIVIATLHYGNWELLAIYGGYTGLPLQIVAEEMRNTDLEMELRRLRSMTDNQMISQRNAGLKLLKAIRRGEAASLLIDQNAPEETGGDWFEFFGLPSFCTNVAAALAVRTGAKIFSSHATPLRNGKVRLVYGPEIPYTLTGDTEADIRRINQQCIAHFEELIRAHPEYWLWAYKRWKHRRDLNDDRYPFYTSDAVLSLRKTGEIVEKQP